MLSYLCYTLQSGLKLKPYHPYFLHDISDYPNTRVQFCGQFIDKCEGDDTIPYKIFWTDESLFKLNDCVNRHNSVYWTYSNPHKIIAKEGNTLGMWIVICATALFGLFFYQGTVTGGCFGEMLDTDFPTCVAYFENFNNMC